MPSSRQASGSDDKPVASMAEHIRESNLIENVDDPREDQRSVAAWGWLLGHDFLTPAIIRELHGLITVEQLPDDYGRFRTVQVWVGDYTPPPAIVVEHLVFDWCMDLMHTEAMSDPKGMHVRFEQIHPFIDGNGRTGRMLMWWQEVKRDMEPTLLKAADRQQYYQWFQANTKPRRAKASTEPQPLEEEG